MTATNTKCSVSARRALLAASLMLAPQPLLAAPRDEVKAGVTRCDGISDDRAWLDCFYGAAQPMRSHLGLSPAPDFQRQALPSTPTPTRPAAPQEGGLLSALAGDGDIPRQ